jgi:hypothetical protein
VNCFPLSNRFRDFWRAFNAGTRRRFPELPPCDLLRSLRCGLGDVDYDEFVRAKWMWMRKPKSLLSDGLSILVCIGLVPLLIPYSAIGRALGFSNRRDPL